MAIDTAYMIELVRDRLTDARMTTDMSMEFFQRKQSFRQVLRAINDADIALCTELKPRGVVGVYLPAGTKQIYLESQADYAHKHESSIASSSLANKDPFSLELLLNDSPWVDVSTVVSTHLHVYNEYPTGAAVPVGRIRGTDFESLQTRRQGLYAAGTTYPESSTAAFVEQPLLAVDMTFTIFPDQKVIELSGVYDSPRYLVFEAILYPGRVRVDTIDKDEPECYHIRTPDLYQDLLADATMVYLSGQQPPPDELRARIRRRKPGTPTKVHHLQGSYANRLRF